LRDTVTNGTDTRKREVTPIMSHQLGRKKLEQNRLELDQGRVFNFNTKRSPNTNHQPALVINFIRFIVWVDFTPTELLRQGTCPKSRWPPVAVNPYLTKRYKILPVIFWGLLVLKVMDALHFNFAFRQVSRGVKLLTLTTL
jgi:hypothetical protein